MIGADGEQQFVQRRALAGVQSGRRLVQAEQRGLRAHRARDLEPPLVAIGEVAGRVVGAIEEIHPLEPVARLIDRAALGAV